MSNTQIVINLILHSYCLSPGDRSQEIPVVLKYEALRDNMCARVLEDIFAACNGYPNLEKHKPMMEEWFKVVGRSMSVGDVVTFKDGRDIWQCMPIGWEPISFYG
jgi:hypothetical protein